jgi:beta-phosphoglucomutase-like phosphatase (HAD superfamily)
MLRAVIFDCDGVLADTEPAHLASFQATLAEEGVELTREQYFHRYLAFDDVAFFRMVYEDRSLALDDATLARLLDRKGGLLAARLADIPPREDACVFAREAVGSGLAVAVASGARRAEVSSVLERGGLAGEIPVVVAAEDVERGKPDPAPFLEALRLLNLERWSAPLDPAECLVVEDAIHGVRAGRAAGMRVVALTTSYGEEDLAEADLVLPDLFGWTPERVDAALVARGSPR